MELLLIARILIALVGTGIAAWYDIFNKKNVPDNMLYAFLAVALIINIFDPTQFISKLPFAVLIILFLYLMYRSGQMGGADLIVLAAIYSAIPMMSVPLLSSAPSPIADILPIPSLFTILALSAVFCALWLVAKMGPRLFKDTIKGKIKFKTLNIAMAVIMLAVYIFLLAMIIQISSFLPISMIHMAFLTIIVALVFVFSIYKDALMSYMLVWKRKVENEDVIFLDALPSALVKRMHLDRLVTLQQMKKMNKMNRKWPVLDLPAFLPCILIALILYILFGDSILFFA